MIEQTKKKKKKKKKNSVNYFILRNRKIVIENKPSDSRFLE